MANVITVAALNKYVKSLLESDAVLTDIAIKGEINNFNQHYKTGHCYFTIKDDKASVAAVMFRSDSQRLAFRPENGMAVLARCRVSLFERDGKYQLYVEDLFPDGMGAAQMAFEQLKARLAAEGLFAPETKKPLPQFPKRVGLVTSKTGAALQDILKVAAHRCPNVHFMLAPVTVQGEAAASEIADAILQLDQEAGCDVLIVARGGGSTNDLWVFNAEEIARAAFVCQTPLVSAIGHEIDFTILDFVADLRAPTPSAAAEMALPDMAHYQTYMMNLYTLIAENMHSRLETCYNRLDTICTAPVLESVRQKPAEHVRYVASIGREIERNINRRLQGFESRLQAGAALAHSLNPYAVLARGYSVTAKEGKTLRSVKQVDRQDTITVTLADGSMQCEVQKITSKSEE